MRITALCAFLLLLVLPFSFAGGYIISIDPTNPVETDDLVCSTNYPGSWYPTWDVNGIQVFDSNSDLFVATTLPDSYSVAGDQVTCSVWQPLADPFDDQLVGSATVTITEVVPPSGPSIMINSDPLDSYSIHLNVPDFTLDTCSVNPNIVMDVDLKNYVTFAGPEAASADVDALSWSSYVISAGTDSPQPAEMFLYEDGIARFYVTLNGNGGQSMFAVLASGPGASLIGYNSFVVNVIDSCPQGSAPQILTPSAVTLTLPSATGSALQIYQLDDYAIDDQPVEQITWSFSQDNNHATVQYYPIETVVTIDFPFLWWTIPMDITVPAHTLIISAQPENNPATTQQTVLTLNAQDAQGNSASEQMVITVVNPFISGNQPPVLSSIPDVTLEEGQSTSFDLDDFVTDDSDPDSALLWQVSGNSNVQVNINPVTHIVTIQGVSGFLGTNTITLGVIDTDGDSSSTMFDVTIVPAGGTIGEVGDLDKPKVNGGTDVTSHRFSVGRIQPVSFQSTYSPGQSVEVLVKLENRGTADEQLDLNLITSDGSQTVQKVGVDERSTKWTRMTFIVPPTASGWQTVRLITINEQGDSSLAYWAFRVA